MKTDKPFLKAFSFGAVYYILFFGVLVAVHCPNIPYRFGYAFPYLLIPSVIIGIIARQSKRPWSWLKAGVYTLFAVVLILLPTIGRLSSQTKQTEQATEQNTYLIKVPEHWSQKPISAPNAKFQAVNPNSTKFITILEVQVDPAMSIKDSRYEKGLLDGIKESGGKIRASGLTIINGITAYRVLTEQTVDGRPVFGCQYSIAFKGSLYAIILSSTEGLPETDAELQSSMQSFRVERSKKVQTVQ